MIIDNAGWNDVVIEGFVPWEALPETGGALDPPVRPLVVALNALPWAHTVFSCAGHPEEPDAGERGRRQAHVDVLVADVGRWRAFVRRVRLAAPAAVRAVAAGLVSPAGIEAPPRSGVRAGVGLRVADGSLGPPPPWLRAALRGEGAWEGPRRGAPGWQQLLPDALTAAPDAQGRRWRYRRLVLEPVPYHLEAPLCRAILDAALEAARQALEPEHAG
jgi:hypothetical protein